MNARGERSLLLPSRVTVIAARELAIKRAGFKKRWVAEGDELYDLKAMSKLTSSLFRVNPALFLTLLLLSKGILEVSFAADWNRHRGPDLDGISKEDGLRTRGVAPVLWDVQVGLGYSTPVISRGRVIVPGHDGKDQDTLFCFDEKTGELRWQFSYPQPLGDLYFQGGTTGSATVDGDQVYRLAREGELFCLDVKTGEVLWQKHLVKDFQYSKPTWGFAGSPLVWDDRLFLNVGDAGLCLSKSDGSLLWKSKNEEAGYSTPLPVTRDGARFIIFSNKRAYVCVEAGNGEEVWRYKWMTRYGVNAADPIIVGDTIFISTGYEKGATLLKWPEGRGTPEKIWQNREMKVQMSAPVLIDGYLYGVSGNEGQDGTGLCCLELSTGTVQWQDPSIGHGTVSAVQGNLVVLTEEGDLQVGAATPTSYQATFQQKVLEPKVWTVPVYANGRVYCRNSSGHLVVLRMKGGK